jgi:IS605 OrfB family transposase
MSALTCKTLLDQFEGSTEYKLKTEIVKLKNKINECENKKNKTNSINSKIIILKNELDELQLRYENEKQVKTKLSQEFYKTFLKNDYQLLSQLPFQYSYTKSLIHNKVLKDFKIAYKDFLSGKRKAINYKKNFPLMVQAKDLGFKFDENSDNVYINYVFGIKFKIIKPTKKKYKNYLELNSVLDNVKNGIYIPQQCNLQFDDSNCLILNLTLEIPEKQKSEKVSGRIMGIDLGIKIPAYCAINDNPDIRKRIGDFDDYFRVSQDIKKRRRNLYRSLKYTKGGHGRDRKIQALARFENKQSNYNKTYNECVSAEVIKFAINNKVEQINIELLSLQKKKGRSMLGDWPYYQLGQMIKRKAEAVGIIVKYVDPYYTSQICNVCDHYEKGQREKQEEFICKSCGIKLNADYNAARNIAKSIKYVNNKEESEWYKQYKNKRKKEFESEE